MVGNLVLFWIQLNLKEMFAINSFLLQSFHQSLHSSLSRAVQFPSGKVSCSKGFQALAEVMQLSLSEANGTDCSSRFATSLVARALPEMMTIVSDASAISSHQSKVNLEENLWPRPNNTS